MLLEEQSQESVHEQPPVTQTKARTGRTLSALLVTSALAVVAWKGTHSASTSSVGGVIGLSEDQCFDGGEEELEMILPKHKANSPLEVPKIPQSEDKYAYATEWALVSIPNKCFEKMKDKIRKHTTITDRGADEGTAYFYLGDLGAEDDILEDKISILADMGGSDGCACGLLIEMHGSGGPGWSAVQFAAIFANAGYIAILPNSMAQPEDMGLKGKTVQEDPEKISTSAYCGSFNAFDKGGRKCSGFSQPYCYSTKFENVIEDSEKYRKYVEGIYTIRKLEMDSFIDSSKQLLEAFDNVYLAGNSEGAMAASRYHHADLDAKLKGRILSAWSCNYNYFVSCAKHAEICEGECSKEVPQLNLIGQKDEYFGAVDDSMSSRVAADEKGYGGPITGNCRAAYDNHGFTKATVVEFKGAGHGPQYWDDNLWRSAIADFISHKGDDAAKWESLAKCEENDGAWVCPAVPHEKQTCCPDKGGSGGCDGQWWTMNTEDSTEGSIALECPASD